MKNIIVIFFLLFSYLHGEEVDGNGVNPIELLVTKIGITGMNMQLEELMSKSSNQDVKIEELKAKLDNILKILQEIQLKSEGYSLPKSNDKVLINQQVPFDQSEEYNSLLVEIKKLKEAQTTVKLNNNFYVNKEKINIRELPSLNSKIVASMQKNDLIKIESCSIFGWCKLSDNRGYVADFLISK